MTQSRQVVSFGSRDLTFVIPWVSFSLPHTADHTQQLVRLPPWRRAFSPLLSAQLSLFPLTSLHLWEVRISPHTLCFPSSTAHCASAAGTWWHRSLRSVSQSLVSICSCLHCCMMRNHQSLRHGCNAYLLDWKDGFQNPKQGDSTTGRKLFLQMSPRWLIERLNRFKEQDLNNVGRCDQMMDKRR